MLVASRDFRLKTVEFSPDEYLKLRQTLKGMDYDRRKSLILALKSKAKEASVAANTSAALPVGSNAKLLSSEKTLTVTDAHTAVYHVKYSKKIFTYDGKIREGEVKVEYNPACEEARIISATVISTNGSRQEISPGEINYMDQGWNAGARRYTGGKILVASLPGVDIGSTIEVEYEVKMKNLPFLSGYEPFQFPDALDNKSFTLSAPFGLTIQKIISGPKDIIKEQDGGDANIQTFEWQAKDVKAVASEPDLPPAWSYQAGVSYYVGDVADYWGKLGATLLSHARKSSSASTLAQQ